MNTNNATPIIIGGLIGAGIGYLFADWYIDTYIPYEEEDLTQPLDPKEFGDRFTVRERKAKKETKPVVKNYAEFFRTQGRPELAELAAKYNGGTLDAPAREEEEYEGLRDAGLADAEEDEDDTEEMMDDGRDPGIISVDVYAGDDELSHITLNYYMDDIITDPNNIPINRPEKFLPDDALTSFGRMSGDPDIVYVRNRIRRTMYEIVRLNKNYATFDEKSKERKDEGEDS